jgi:hypothetical protein
MKNPPMDRVSFAKKRFAEAGRSLGIDVAAL